MTTLDLDTLKADWTACEVRKADLHTPDPAAAAVSRALGGGRWRVRSGVARLWSPTAPFSLLREVQFDQGSWQAIEDADAGHPFRATTLFVRNGYQGPLPLH